MKTATVLKRAKKLIEKGGWTQQRLRSMRKGRDGEPAYCIMGALQIAAGVPVNNLRNCYTDIPSKYRDTIKEALDVMEACLPAHRRGSYVYGTYPREYTIMGRVETFNDKDAKSEDEVINFLNCAIRSASE